MFAYVTEVKVHPGASGGCQAPQYATPDLLSCTTILAAPISTCAAGSQPNGIAGHREALVPEAQMMWASGKAVMHTLCCRWLPRRLPGTHVHHLGF